MEDNTRINRRSRPRPYDLRRKVLLKNFLREQMTHIPVTRVQLLPQNNIVHFSEESSVSDHVDIAVENESSSLASSDTTSPQSDPSSSDNNNNSDHLISDSNKEAPIINSDADTNSADDSGQESSIFKFTRFMKFKRESKKKLKGIFKAKDVRKNIKSPVKTRSFKSGLERVFYSRKKPESSHSGQMSRNSSRSLFSMFKSRRQQRHDKVGGEVKNNPGGDFFPSDVSTKYDTISQSVQTDDSWGREEMVKVHQSNRRLKEENRFLSESLSYFMSSASMDPHVMHSSSPLQSSNRNMTNSMVYPDYYIPSSNTGRDNWSSRSRVSRSKSVHEYSERKNLQRNHYRTRSASFHNSQNYSLSNVKPSSSMHSSQREANSIPRIRRKNTFSNNVPNNSGRNIQRRSSMPERTLSENDRSVVYRRTGSVRNIGTRRPFHTLPSDAFY